jgi:hypothetical protein
MEIADELKRKLAALSKRIQEITREQLASQCQLAALDEVIALYEPGYVPEKAEAPRGARGYEGCRRDQALLSSVNKRQAVLQILRDAGRPLSTAECAARFAGRLGLADDDPRPGQIANRLSAALDSLAKAERVRHAGMVDGRRVLWEISV